MTKRYPTAEVARNVPMIVGMYDKRKNKKDSFTRWYNNLIKLFNLLDSATEKYKLETNYAN